jgi:hypothetical protein
MLHLQGTNRNACRAVEDVLPSDIGRENVDASRLARHRDRRHEGGSPWRSADNVSRRISRVHACTPDAHAVFRRRVHRIQVYDAEACLCASGHEPRSEIATCTLVCVWHTPQPHCQLLFWGLLVSHGFVPIYWSYYMKDH